MDQKPAQFSTDPFLQQAGSAGMHSDDSDKPKGFAGLAWLGIIVVVAAIFGSRYLVVQAEEGKQVADEMGQLLMKLQSRYMLGAAEMVGEDRQELFPQAKELLEIGSVGQRQRFVILASELAGPFEAKNALEQLESDLANPPEGDPPVLTTDQEELQVLLHKLYDQATVEEQAETHLARIDALSSDDRNNLIKYADWFGELALAPPDTKAAADREAITSPASQMVIIIVGIFIFVALVGLAGFIGLVVLSVFTITGKVKSQMTLASKSHGIYAETFALWMMSFFALQVAVQLIIKYKPEMIDHALFINFIAFIISLSVLAWPVWRGFSWSQVRQDIGWTTDRLKGLEPLIGIAGYAMTLPILAIGLLLVVLLGILQSMFSGPLPTFTPAGGPAHPIIMNLANGDLWTYVQIYLVATVGAPIVEETMFRGVLYQHLRSASRNMGILVSVLLSTLLNTFLFALIHPQGWVAIPALMSLAIGFTLLREWRGTLIPSIFVHGINNGLVMTMMIVLL